MTTNNPHDYLQVDLGVDYRICAIATKGSAKDSHWSTTYTVSYSPDNKHWTDYQENGKLKIFSGNKDKNTPRKHVLLSKPIFRFVRVYPVSSRNWKAIRLELYGVYIDNCKRPLGLENYGIDDSQITVFYRNKHNKPTSCAQCCRLHGQSSWKPLNNNAYLEVDLGQRKVVKGIATQGDPLHSIWVTSFTLEFKSAGGSWYEYTPSHVTESFKGNIDNNGIAVHWFDVKQYVRYVRFHPRTWHKHVAVRMELYGCEESCDNQPIGIHDSSVIVDDAISTSSSNETIASHVRSAGVTSWCSTDNKTYLQVDLGMPYLLCAVATQGNSEADQWVELYNLQISLDGQTWEYHKHERGRPKALIGNFDRSSTSKHILDSTPLARYARFLIVRYFGWRCMRINLYGITQQACSKSIAGASVTGQLPYYRFTASSYKSAYHVPSMARLFGPSCWTPKTEHDIDYLQVDLGDPFVVCGVASQGCNDQSAVLSYDMAYSIDGHTWTFYHQNTRHKMVFEGNQGKSEKFKKHILTKRISAKFVRFYPLTSMNHKSLRIEVYGTRQAWRRSLGVEVQYGVSDISDKQLSASQVLDAIRTEAEGRLYGPLCWCTTQQHKPYFEIDLQTPREVAGIATQGDSFHNYIQEYDLQYSYTSDRWMAIQALQGNVDSKTVRVQWLTPPVGARYVRVIPTKWHGMICLRTDLYGNHKVPAPKITSKKVIGQLMPIASSHVIVECVAYADPTMQLRWFLTSHDVTNRSRGQVYSRGRLVSTLQVNFTSPSDTARGYSCVERDDFTVDCTVILTCQGKSKDAWSDNVDNKITIQMGKDAFTSAWPPPSTTQVHIILASLPDSEHIRTPSNYSLSLESFHLLVTCLFVVFTLLVSQ